MASGLPHSMTAIEITDLPATVSGADIAEINGGRLPMGLTSAEVEQRRAEGRTNDVVDPTAPSIRAWELCEGARLRAGWVA